MSVLLKPFLIYGQINDRHFRNSSRLISTIELKTVGSEIYACIVCQYLKGREERATNLSCLICEFEN